MSTAYLLFCLQALLCISPGVMAEGTQPAGGPGPARLLLLPFNVASQKKELSSLEEGLPDILTAFLSAHSGKVQMLDRAHLNTMVAEAGLRLSGSMAPESALQVGHLLQAQYVVHGSLTEIGEKLEMSLQVYETETTRLVKSFRAEGPAEEILIVAEKVSKELAGFLEKGIKDAAEFEVERDPEKNLHFVRGLGYYYGSQSHKAIPEFMKVLRKDPEDTLALYWMARCFAAAGLSDHANLEFVKFLERYPDHPRVQEAKNRLEAQKESQHE